MSSSLGKLALSANNKNRVFYTEDVKDVENVGDSYNINMLSDPDYIIGFDAVSGKEIELVDTTQHPDFEPIEVSEDTKVVKARFKDADVASSAYDIKVIIQYEEYEEI